MFQKGDFHIHSTASDGELSSEEIVRLAKERGIDIIAITDHNTMLGVEKAIKEGQKYGIRVLPGVELSTRYKGERVHILGYFKDEHYKEEIFQSALKIIKSHKVKKVKQFLKHHKNLDIEVGRNRLQLSGGIKLLKAFDAVVVLAHPVKIRKEYLPEILQMPFDGIEAKHFKNGEGDDLYFMEQAKELGIFYTAGSDFHTNRRQDEKHGLLGEVHLEKEEVEIFLKRAGFLESEKPKEGV